ncbi:MAG: hypothetical protein ACJ74O_16935 [Frankiaceae bacterium]
MSRAAGRFEVDLPDGWFRIDLDPATRERSAGRLVDAWVARRPELAKQRDGLVATIVSTAERALGTHCIYAAAALGHQADVGPTYAGLAVRVLPWPGSIDVDAFVAGMVAAARADEGVTAVEPIQVGGRRMVLVRHAAPADDGQQGTVTSFVVPAPGSGAFANLEFTTPVAPAPEHSFAHIAATIRLS